MVKLESMGHERYESWLKASVKHYAEEKVQAGNVSAEEAMQVAEREFEQIMPEGLATLDTYLFNVKDEDCDQVVGSLWLKVRDEGKEMFIYGLEINEDARGKGYGKQTMQSLEAFVKQMGIPKISLHVFGYNEVAIKLYRSSGYVATNILMSKVL
ncbi:N-acetyltransferase [Alicyclobacillus sp. SO9]|uniref:GNAT family N-acetyltransferase n=1 Tax=Alicyclobacillus sp. SO9 TaxID=2665646 RepID=UPI0018E7D417|nr:GNAT family N-acetyltransferase [Alicyclobacillus sp. SO9]QQE77091.1 GNAT family N-acetyltransferase [Alicyclobacillus sp. SO9]